MGLGSVFRRISKPIESVARSAVQLPVKSLQLPVSVSERLGQNAADQAGKYVGSSQSLVSNITEHAPITGSSGLLRSGRSQDFFSGGGGLLGKLGDLGSTFGKGFLGIQDEAPAAGPDIALDSFPGRGNQAGTLSPVVIIAGVGVLAVVLLLSQRKG